VTLSGTYVADFDNANVGTGKAVTVSGYSINNSNYSLMQPTVLTANITAKALTITGLTADNKLYDTLTTATLSGTESLVGVLGSDTVTLSGTYVADFDNANVGTGKAITVSGYSINNSNYSLTQPTGLTANIAPKALADTVLSVSQLPTEKIGLYDTFFLYKEASEAVNKKVNNINYGYFLEQKNKTANKTHNP
jgi:hypothetical protein